LSFFSGTKAPAHVIISRTPTRISFTGGGSDMATYYRRHGGAVITTAIKRFVYITVNTRFDNRLRLSYSKTEEVDRTSQIEHRLVRAVLEQQQIEGGIEITSVADIPSRGTGLGSSSSFTVGLLNVLHAYQGRFVSKEQLAKEASHIEVERLKDPIGKQDHYAAAFGGFNFMRFNPDNTVDIEPLSHFWPTIKKIEAYIQVFYTGITRSAADILTEQQLNVEQSREKRTLISRMVCLAQNLRNDVVSGTVDSLGEILHESWLLKRQLASGVSSNMIDDLYNRARAAGAIGGKILGAGGGGFLMIYAAPDRHEAIAKALRGLRRIPMYFERQGSLIVFCERNEE
jgi:D-glycero-alpha-D-manno-heptose-7-phosphate kinase